MLLINSALKFLDCRKGTSERRSNPVCKRAGGSRGRWSRLLMGWTCETHKGILLSHWQEPRQSSPCSGEKGKETACFSLRTASLFRDRGWTWGSAEKGTSFRQSGGVRTGKTLILGSRARNWSFSVSGRMLTACLIRRPRSHSQPCVC